MKRKRWILCLGILLGLFLASPAGASEYDSSPIRKFWRGGANLLTGWMELPIQVSRVTEAEGTVAGVFVGFGKGLVFGLGRTAMGALEMVTFLLPNHTSDMGPAPDAYGPIIEPEFIVIRSADKP